jgi:AAA+ ATPase superfamily predicted ATPase
MVGHVVDAGPPLGEAAQEGRLPEAPPAVQHIERGTVAVERPAARRQYNETLARSSPLYGRRTGQWLLEPMRFKNVCAFHGSLDPVTKLELWALTGGVPANQLTRYLGALSDLGLVTREVPVTERAPEKSKRGLYQLDDAFLRLWFGCVVTFESLLEFGRVEQVETLMQERLARQVAWAFERACRQHAEDELVRLGGVKVGRFWDRHAEVDVVAVDEDGRVMLAGECKWSNRRVGLEVGKALEQKVQTLWPDRAGEGDGLGAQSLRE